MQEVLQRHLERTATCCLASAGSAFMLTVTVPWDKPDLLRLLCFLHRGSSHVRSCYRATLGCSDVHTHTGKPHLAHPESSECPEVCFATSLACLMAASLVGVETPPVLSAAKPSLLFLPRLASV